MYITHCMIVSSVESPIQGNKTVAVDQVASISLPSSVFDNISGRTEVGVFFALYRKSTLFPIRAREHTTGAVAGRATIVGSSIIAATVGPGLSFSNLQSPVMINLSVPTEIHGSVNLPFFVFNF